MISESVLDFFKTDECLERVRCNAVAAHVDKVNKIKDDLKRTNHRKFKYGQVVKVKRSGLFDTVFDVSELYVVHYRPYNECGVDGYYLIRSDKDCLYGAIEDKLSAVDMSWDDLPDEVKYINIDINGEIVTIKSFV